MRTALHRFAERMRKTRLFLWLRRFSAHHPALWQFVLFNLLSLCATATDLGVFLLLNSVLLTRWRTVPVTWWLLDYTEAAGGLAALIATAAAYLCAQIVNFFVQRKGTFHADNNVAKSGVLYLMMIVGIWFFQIYFSARLLQWFNPLFGEALGGILMRLANGMISLLIQFPLNKFVIMRSRDKRPTP